MTKYRKDIFTTSNIDDCVCCNINPCFEEPSFEVRFCWLCGLLLSECKEGCSLSGSAKKIARSIFPSGSASFSSLKSSLEFIFIIYREYNAAYCRPL